MMTKYVSQLNVYNQVLIKMDVIEELEKLGYSNEDLGEIVEDAMDSRLCDLSDLIDITPYLKKEGWILKCYKLK